MKRHLILIPLTGILLSLLIACGGDKKAVSLEGKKLELKELKNQLVSANRKIQELEAEIAEMDTTNKKIKTVSVEVSTIKAKTFKHYVKVQGQVVSNKNIQVSPKTSGVITKLNVREGQSVKAGQILAKLDDAVMTRNIEEVRTQLELATILYQKQKNLWDQKIGTEVQFLTSKNQKESLERRLETMEEQLDMTNIKAPISGVVDKVVPKAGEMVSAGFPAFKIVNISDLRLEAKLSESYSPFIKRGDEVNVSFPTLQKEMTAKVTLVGQTIDPQSRTFIVEVKLPVDRMIKPNMFGEISINDRTSEEAIVISQSLLQKSENGNYLYVGKQTESGHWIAERRNIQLGLSFGGKVEVVSGLQADDQVIIAGFKDLSNGQAISFTKTVATTK